MSALDPLADTDRLGRAVPHKLMFARLLQGMPWMLRHFTVTVPAKLLTRVEDRYTVVDCPCGLAPQLEPGYSHVCDCGRHYFHAGYKMLVAPAPRVD